MNIITEQGGQGQEKRFWAKMTQFKKGGFELAVIAPRVPPERLDPLVTVKKGTSCHFSKPPPQTAPDAVWCPRRVLPALTEEEQKAADKSNLERSVRRARQSVRKLIKSLDADHMLTFSYRENVEDIDRVKGDWKRFTRAMRARYPEWQFVCVRERQDRGALHMHVAVKGKQDIRWILRCWLLAIGQGWEDVQQWYVHQVALGSKSLGAVNVRAPSKRWGGVGHSWRPERLAGYLTKYLAKEFELAEHHSKRYWHSEKIDKPIIIKFWLGASSFIDAIRESHHFVHSRGAYNMSMWAADDWFNLWISGDGVQLELELLPLV